MSRMLVRPPASFLSRREAGALDQPLPRGGRGDVDSAKAWGGRSAGSVDARQPAMYDTYWIDTLQVNPAHDQPKLIYYSGGQPIVRWGFRRFVRTRMSASPRFFGRWVYVGLIQNQFVARGRLRGVPTRQGTSYAYPAFQVAPRNVQLGGGG
jgi:hypothetical protein